MNPFDHMSQQFVDDNREALDEALYNQVIGIDQPDTLGDCLQMGMEGIGNGIAWFGFWIGVGLVSLAVGLAQ